MCLHESAWKRISVCIFFNIQCTFPTPRFNNSFIHLDHIQVQIATQLVKGDNCVGQTTGLNSA